MSFYDNLTSAEKLRLTERLLPQLDELLAIARKLAADLMNNGTSEAGCSHTYTRDETTHCEEKCFHMDQPHPSYPFIEVGYEWRPGEDASRKVPRPYVKWNKDGADYSIKWNMDPNASRRETIARKFLCFRWNANVLRRIRKVTAFEFETSHNDDGVCFQMNQRELDSMPVALHDSLCNALAALKYQSENVIKCISTASTRKKMDDRKNTMRHVEELLEQAGNTKTTTTNHGKQ